MTTGYVVRVSQLRTGSCAHRMGSIVPPVGQRPACAQVYILDGAAQVEARRGLPWGGRLDVDILSGLTDMLMAVEASGPLWTYHLHQLLFSIFPLSTLVPFSLSFYR